VRTCRWRIMNRFEGFLTFIFFLAFCVLGKWSYSSVGVLARGCIQAFFRVGIYGNT
jgi:hypothetical protein